MSLSPNTTLAHYTIISKIGAGGMGEVYRARDTRLDREVAIKILPQNYSADIDRLKRFEQEASATSALNHPNILTIYDIGIHDGSPYIVAELLQGQELREQLNQGLLPERKTQTEANEAAATLSPDGKWIAYTSDESGRYEVYVQSFPAGGGKRQISTAGGIGPRWARNELFFHSADGRLMAASVTTGANLEAGVPVPLFEFRPGGSLITPYYAVTKDGQRFLLNTIIDTQAAAPLTVITNWGSELKR
jgi:hypothetical protein